MFQVREKDSLVSMERLQLQFLVRKAWSLVLRHTGQTVASVTGITAHLAAFDVETGAAFIRGPSDLDGLGSTTCTQ
jgi:hypothetical protein